MPRFIATMTRAEKTSRLMLAPQSMHHMIYDADLIIGDCYLHIETRAASHRWTILN